MSAVRSSPSPSSLNTRNNQRLSHLSSHSIVSSSATSFKTAPLTAPSRSQSSRSSSAHTVNQVGKDADSVNPIHTIATSQEVHILKVTNNTVQLEAGPVSETFFEKVSRSILHTELPNGDAHVGQPPPSPPDSMDREFDYRDKAGGGNQQVQLETAEPRPSRFLVSSQSEPTAPLPKSRIESEPIRERQASTSSHYTSRTTDSLQPRSSIETRDSGMTQRTITASQAPAESSTSQLRSSTQHSADGHLHPPPAPLHRPARRNTTGSTPLVPSSPSRTSFPTHTFSKDDATPGEVSDGLASDMELHAEKIRRERMSKRAKQQQEAEAALTRPGTRGSSTVDQKDVPLVGNLIGEDHVNYVLMYNMLTGIRIGVSRCQAKIKRELKAEDFQARHKFSFDIVGNELTPSAKYDFKFKDYAPWVFRTLREDHFNLDPADYLLSLTAKYILSELGSPGKSGSFFYFSRDYRFIIKTIRHSEHKFLLSILPDYFEHVKENPHTLLSRFYGLHRVKLPRGHKIHFVIMNNLFPPHRDIHETYDLKGSTIGREYPEERAATNPRAVMKDLNWINRGNQLELGPEKRALLTEQLRRDAEFLKKINVMDYSLLVGTHNMLRGNRDNLRKNTLKVFSPDIPNAPRISQAKAGSRSPEAVAMRRAMRSSDPKRLGRGTIRLPESDPGEGRGFVFYQDEGGIRATDEENQPLDKIYYLGVIDILTPYGVVKRLEHFWKGLKADRHKISPVPPTEYSDRFFSFMKAIMRGGEGGARFKSE